MIGIMPKKLLPLCILRILETYTDENHKLLQKQIKEKVESEYGIICDRKTVQQNIIFLQEFGYEIAYEDGYYLSEREFDESELRLLIDSVLFSRSVSSNQARTLIEKLKGLSNQYFSNKVKHVSNVNQLNHTDNKQIFYTLDILDEAIEKKKKVSFTYAKYGVDKKLHPIREKKYVVSPYQMVAKGDRYYLIANVEKYDDVIHFRLDRMLDVELLKEKARPKKEVKGMQNWDMPKHMAEHVYMFSQESVNVRFEADKSIISEIVDWFGKDFTVLEEKENTVLIHLKCNEIAMFFWAMQFSEYVTIQSPDSLREKICQVAGDIVERYKK